MLCRYTKMLLMVEHHLYRVDQKMKYKSTRAREYTLSLAIDRRLTWTVYCINECIDRMKVSSTNTPARTDSLLGAEFTSVKKMVECQELSTTDERQIMPKADRCSLNLVRESGFVKMSAGCESEEI